MTFKVEGMSDRPNSYWKESAYESFEARNSLEARAILRKKLSHHHNTYFVGPREVHYKNEKNGRTMMYKIVPIFS
jgi:hypothetical protein